MTHPEKNVLINSTFIRITSALLSIVFHELGHFCVSIGLGNSATLRHNNVQTHTENLDFINQVLIPMGGPIVSLAHGVVCLLLYRKIKNSTGSLLTLWLGISGLMAFFGYMMIAPISTVGDKGKIFQLLEIPMLWQVIISVSSLLLFTIMLLRFHLDFERFVPEDISEEKFKRAKWARLLILYTVLIGIFFNTIIQFPIVHFLSLLPSLTMPFMLFMVYGQMNMSNSAIEKKENKDVTKFSSAILILFILTIVIYRLLVWGITI